MDQDAQLRATSFQQLEIMRRQEERAKRQEAREVEQHRAAMDTARAEARDRSQAEREAAARAAAADRERARAEARRRHVAAMEDHAQKRNEWTMAVYGSIADLLVTSLDVDDHVDLERFRVHAPHPPFPRPDLLTPIPPPEPLVAPPEPVYVEPPPPSGLGKAFGGENRRIKQVYDAQIAHQQAHQAWQAEVASLPARRAAQEEAHRQQEAARLAELAPIQAAHDAECRRLDEPLAPRNAELDAFIEKLEAGDEATVEQYIGIVVTTSAYPPDYPVSHQYDYDPARRHLSLWVGIPHPDAMPPCVVVRYDEATDELQETPIEAFGDLYASAAYNVALRSLHVAFECDRRELIQEVSVAVGVHGTDPALGTPRWYPLVQVERVARDAFLQVNLREVNPIYTLQHFDAAVSHHMLELAPPLAGFRIEGQPDSR